jgi:hypothetical protein
VSDWCTQVESVLLALLLRTTTCKILIVLITTTGNFEILNRDIYVMGDRGGGVKHCIGSVHDIIYLYSSPLTTANSVCIFFWHRGIAGWVIYYQSRKTLCSFACHRSYKTPSALVQQLFATFQGQLAAATRIEYLSAGDVHNRLVAASTTCSDLDC